MNVTVNLKNGKKKEISNVISIVRLGTILIVNYHREGNIAFGRKEVESVEMTEIDS